MRHSLSRSGRSALHVDRCRCPHRSSRGWVLRHRRRSRHTGRRIDSSCRASRTGTAGQRPEPGTSRGRAPTTPPRHRPQGASGSIDERYPSCPAALPRRPPLCALPRTLVRVGGRHLTCLPWFFYVVALAPGPGGPRQRGGKGIRTLDGLAPLAVFKSDPQCIRSDRLGSPRISPWSGVMCPRSPRGPAGG
jgi:hypothetical protein